jgi:hypothetical protein
MVLEIQPAACGRRDGSSSSCTRAVARVQRVGGDLDEGVELVALDAIGQRGARLVVPLLERSCRRQEERRVCVPAAARRVPLVGRRLQRRVQAPVRSTTTKGGP